MSICVYIISGRIIVLGGGMVLYIEYVLLDNLVIDYFLIRLLGRTFKDNYRKLRILLSLFIGVMGAVFLPYVIGNVFISIIYRLLIAVVMILVLKVFSSIKSVISRTLCFMGYTALISGLIIGVLSVFNIPYTISGVLLYSMELPMGLMVLILAIVIYVIDRIIKVYLCAISNSKYIHNITIENDGVVVDIRGLCDSGNMLSIDGECVSIISLNLFMKLYSDVGLIDLINKKNNLNNLKNIKYIDVGGVSRKEKLLSFVVDKIKLDNREYCNQRLAMAYKNFDEFDCILSSSYLGVGK